MQESEPKRMAVTPLLPMGSLKGALIAIAALWLLAACATPPDGALDPPGSVGAYAVGVLVRQTLPRSADGER